jgi:hypothetical protein
VPQENSLCVYFKFKKKCHFFLFFKFGEQEDGTGPARGVDTSGRGEEVGKECDRVIIVQIL